MSEGSGFVRRNLIRILVWGVAILLCTVAALDHYDIFPLVRPDRERWPVRGLDISQHQGEIEFGELGQSEELHFLFVKATEGGDWVDERFPENWRRARERGLATGAYHFFTPCRRGAEQAQNFIRTVPRAPGALPPVVDAEVTHGCESRAPGIRDLDSELLAFLEAVEAHYGQVPILYTTLEFYDVILANDPAYDRYPLWVRSMSGEPELPDGRPWTFWQFSDRGRTAGIEGPVDRNLFRGSLEELRQLQRPRGGVEDTEPRVEQ